MPRNIETIETDVVIAGAGAGGCTLAKELSKTGKNVVMLEKGGDNAFLFGTPIGVYLKLEKSFRLPIPIRATIESENLILANGIGGGTLVYAASAFLPDIKFWQNVGIDIPQDIIDETVKETWAAKPPEAFIGQGAKRIYEAANELGFPFETCKRHVDFEKCEPGCAKCVMGCVKEAKWTARVYANEAAKNGAKILTHINATRVITENGLVAGIRAKGVFKNTGKKYEIHAPVVVCAAGGLATAEILKNSGIAKAGSWFSGDPTTLVFGFLKKGDPGNGYEHNMTMGFYDEKHHIVFCSMLAPFPAWHLQFLQDEHLRAVLKLNKYRRTLGVFAKCSDDGAGKLYKNGKISNTYTEADRARFSYGLETCKKILVKAGCDPGDIHQTSFTLGHPSGTVKVGELLDSNLETEIKNLYCCDTSITPGAPGRPPALTIVAIAKRLAKRLSTII